MILALPPHAEVEFFDGDTQPCMFCGTWVRRGFLFFFDHCERNHARVVMHAFGKRIIWPGIDLLFKERNANNPTGQKSE